MRKYNPIFKEARQLRESNGEWNKFTDLMRTFGYLKFDLTTTPNNFYINLTKMNLINSKGGEVVFSKSDAHFVIQLENFSHFTETPGQVIVYSKNNLEVKISWK